MRTKAKGRHGVVCRLTVWSICLSALSSRALYKSTYLLPLSHQQRSDSVARWAVISSVCLRGCVCVFVNTILELFEVPLWNCYGSKISSKARTNSNMAAFRVSAARGWWFIVYDVLVSGYFTIPLILYSNWNNFITALPYDFVVASFIESIVCGKMLLDFCRTITRDWHSILICVRVLCIVFERLQPLQSNHQFLPRDAMHKRGLCRHAVSVCLSVCVSVTFVSCVKTNKHIKIFPPSGSHTILVFQRQTG